MEENGILEKMKYEIIKDYKNERFRQVTGVNIDTFKVMVGVLNEADKERQKVAGRKRKLSIEDMLLLTLEYYKEYRTFDCIGASYGLSKSNVCETIKWVETILIKCGLFNLSGKKALLDPKTEIEVIFVDTTEMPIERPKKGQKHYYSGKKNDIR